MIRLAGGYGIRADSDCWVFGKVVERKDKHGNPVEQFDRPRFTTDLSRCLELYVERCMLDSDPASLNDLTTALRDAASEVRKVSAALAGVVEA